MNAIPHYVNVETKLFSDPNDLQVPSTVHPCIPVTGGVLSVVLLTTFGYPYPITEGQTAVCTITQNGVMIMRSTTNGSRSDGLQGKLTFQLTPVSGAVMSFGIATISIMLSSNVLVDTVQITEAPVLPDTGCGCLQPVVMTNLGVIESYVAPSEALTGQYVLYLGPTGQLIRGCIYKCDLVDGSYAWIPKTDAADDNLRVIEWQL